MFLRSGNLLLTFLLIYHIWGTSNIQVFSQFKRFSSLQKHSFLDENALNLFAKVAGRPHDQRSIVNFIVMSFHVMSRHATSCHVMSRHVMLWHVTSCHVMPRRVTSCHVMLRHITSCHMSRHVTSCHVESRMTVTRPTLYCQLNFSHAIHSN